MKKLPLMWMDLEMTGLNENNDHILEVAAIITDLDFNPLETYESVVFQTEDVVNGMNDWCKKHHGESGLTAKIPFGKPLLEVENDLIQLIKRHFPNPARVVIAGNSIGNDRRFIDKYWPEFSKHLHYRMIDVSSYKEIFRDKFGVEFKKKNAHRAIGDIEESINELKHYLSFVKI